MSDNKISNLWMVPYADLMSSMVILFLMLFVFSYNAKRGADFQQALALMQKDLGTDEGSRKLKEAELARKMETMLQKEISLGKLGVEVTTTKVKLVFASPVLFESASATLKPEAAAMLKTVADTLRGMNNQVIVEGHTDNIPVGRGRFKSNWELSAGRAFSVIDYFSRQGLDARRFTALGHAEHQPVAPNDTEENRAKNRRIEITIIRE